MDSKAQRASLSGWADVLARQDPNLKNQLELFDALQQSPSALQDAITEAHTTLERKNATLGPRHPETLQAMHSLATRLKLAGKLRPAYALHGAALAARRRTLGDRHEDTLASLKSMAMLLVDQGEFETAEPLWREALDAYGETLGPRHPFTQSARVHLAKLLVRLGDEAGAIPLLRAELQVRRSAPFTFTPHLDPILPLKLLVSHIPFTPLRVSRKHWGVITWTP